MIVTPRTLTDRAITRFKTPGMHRVANSLYVHVSKKGARDWIFRYRGKDGRRHDMGLGSCKLFGFHETMAAAIECRRLLYHGFDPIEHRRGLQAAERAERRKFVSWRDCIDGFEKNRIANWSLSYRKKWRETLDRYATRFDCGDGAPLAGLSIDLVEERLIIELLEPVWKATPVTANKLRNWIERIINFATAKKIAHRRRAKSGALGWSSRSGFC
jgi:hypothetical protein